MNISEFKAFLEGMDVEDAPTKEQWDRIADKIAQLTTLSPVDIKPSKPWPLPVNPYDAPLFPYGQPIVTCGMTKGDGGTAI